MGEVSYAHAACVIAMQTSKELTHKQPMTGYFRDRHKKKLPEYLDNPFPDGHPGVQYSLHDHGIVLFGKRGSNHDETSDQIDGGLSDRVGLVQKPSLDSLLHVH